MARAFSADALAGHGRLAAGEALAQLGAMAGNGTAWRPAGAMASERAACIRGREGA
jgi:hypothetical protein